MSSAAKAQGLVFRAASPVEPGENIKAQINRAVDALSAHNLDRAYSRVWRAWRGRAGAKTYLAIKDAYDAWCEAQEREARKLDAQIADRMARLMEAMHASDPDFYREDIALLRERLATRFGSTRGAGGQD